MLNIAVVGTGVIGTKHLSAIVKSKSCCLRAVCDINEEAVASISEEYGVPYFTDYREIPNKTNADAVILNLPHWLHCDATIFFLEKGLHVLVEKPMANTLGECRKMLDTAKRTGKKLAVGHLQRFFPANRMVREIVSGGEMGKLCMVTEFRTIDYFADNRPNWFLDKKLSGGGIVMNYGAHAMDKLLYVLQSKPVNIHGVTGNVKNSATIEGHSQIFVDFESGVSACITFCGYCDSGYETVYYFTDGTLKVVGTHQLFKRIDNGWLPLELPDMAAAIPVQLEEFCKFVRGENSEMASGEYGADVIAAIEQIYKEKQHGES